MKVAGFFTRWRHARGFGIHSPFAYRLIREAIRPARGYAYYAELTPRLGSPVMAMAYRIEIFLRSEHFRLRILHGPECARSSLYPREALLCIDPAPEVGGELTDSLRATGKGLAIEGRRYLLLVPREDMSFVSYELP